MGKNLIDKNEILSFPQEDYSGFSNFAYDMINKNNLDDHFDEAYQLCEDILDGLMNVIETAEVFEERESATLQICEHHEDWGDYPRPYYLYHCSSCFESVRQDYPNENFKFCPHCGAQYKIKFVKEK